MQFAACGICAWSISVRQLSTAQPFCEVCLSLLGNPQQTCLAEAGVIVRQMHTSLGTAALRARYLAAHRARVEQESTLWWETFQQRNRCVNIDVVAGGDDHATVQYLF